VLWENTTNEEVMDRARAEIRRSWREVCELNKDHPQAAELFNPEKLPALCDPFAGGGSIPLEAQRLGLEAYASDLNPVAVLINKAMIEIPPKFAGRAPVGPLPTDHCVDQLDLPQAWPNATGLAEDVRRYGIWMQAAAHKRIGHLYTPIDVTAEMARERPDLKSFVGQKLPVLAWIWARTVKSPNPAFSHVDVPLASTFMLSIKADKEIYVEPIFGSSGYRLSVKIGAPKDPEAAKRGTKSGSSGSSFICLMSGAPISFEYVRSEAKAGRMGARLMAVVVESERGGQYLTPTDEMEAIALGPQAKDVPETSLPEKALGFRVQEYGMKRWRDLFTPRQLMALTTFSDLVHEAQERVKCDAHAAGLPDDSKPLDEGGIRSTAYSQVVSVYLGCVLSRLASYNNSICHWNMKGGSVGQIFARQAIPISWDYIEVNPFAKMSGNWFGGVEWVCDVLNNFISVKFVGVAQQLDASKQELSARKFVSTDPPYYDNISYADLSDFFYVWLRRSLKPVFPDLFATLTVPKAEELVATPFRHGGKEKAEAFFLDGMTQAMHRLAEQAHPGAPITIYYAFKQSETDSNTGTSSTGWETFLEAVSRAGLQVSGTWPIRTEKQGRSRANDSNALASSIILVCRKRRVDAPAVSRREFLRELNAVLPEALDEMTKGSGDDRSPVAPVDLSQAIIGPGMAVFSKYAAVLEANGSPMSVHIALQLINRFLAEDDFDHDTQFCLHWFEQNGWKEGRFGNADTLARAKGTSVDRLRGAGVVESGGGIVRLRKWSEYPSDWTPQSEARLPVWETLHQFVRALKNEGESGAGRLLAAVSGKSEAIRQLAYRLHTLCERQGWSEDARAYNELITSWTGIESASSQVPTKPTQGTLFH
jgi:putative DNA methylase